ncbi:C6 zinc finger domain protein [Aspergillus indologenus CBS 114.80]|uniref:C6 zinc finger domain protein n=1 Tax=Aspergillus indologenus CBS 114.80 TaxID=1450541 RepID=A0A2V5HRD1_9EURO|nr:C6 zinc finger domain protein [Aspergillus indologenus CBS 114.80]
MALDDSQPSYQDDGVTAVTQPRTSKPAVVRKKFAKPPVKVACLACRASRTRCDGQDPCTNCITKKRKCSYLPSKRGGPRKKKKLSIPSDEAVQHDDEQSAMITPPSSGFNDDSPEMFGQIDVLSIPGAGLRSLDFPSDVHSMFTDLFVPNGENSIPVQMEPTPSPSNVPSQSLVRTYGSEIEILNAYYEFVHNYFPILPPRFAPRVPDRPLDGVGSFTESPSEEPVIPYRPQSSLSCAISAILALVPHPNDIEPSSPASVVRRRTYAQMFAQMANLSIETDCELQASTTDPALALSTDRPLIDRAPFHPQAPVELESILALLVLSVYEYTQRGNLLKMRYRAGQALSIALDMSLHSLSDDYDEFSEARRRAWWMTYYCVLQGSIVSATPLSIVANDPQFVTPYPRFAADPDGWSVLIQAQQVLVSATQFVVDLNKCVSTRTNMQYIFERMQQLDSWASSALAQSNLLPIVPQTMSCQGDLESTTAQSIRAISRIKLSSAQIKIHRFRAFSDIPIFIKKHCDLTAAATTTNSIPVETVESPATQDGITRVGCSCSSLDMFQQSSSEYTPSSASSTSSEFSSLPPQYSFTNDFPYSSQHSAKICLRASLLISQMFHCLPIPQPLLADDRQQSPPGLQQLLPSQLPRTMPSFACCLMQGSYAMLMIFYKARVEKQLTPPDYGGGSSSSSSSNLRTSPSDRLIEEIRQGLERIIAAATNYAIAFEALDGMRDEIEGAYHTAFIQA